MTDPSDGSAPADESLDGHVGDGSDWSVVRTVFAGPEVLLSFALLVVPLAVGWRDTDRMSPLALPGYVIYTVGSAIGNALAPNYGLVAYWIPFLAGCYSLSVGIAGVVRALRR